MATPTEKLAASLAGLRELQKGGRRVVRSAELSRVHRERLVKHGLLQPVMKGWLMPPAAAVPEETAAAFWEFCARYCTDRFGGEWHVSPEQSLLLAAGVSAIPKRLVVCTPRGTNNTIVLPFGTRIYDLKYVPVPPAADVVERAGVRLLSAAAALTRVPAGFFARHPAESRAALASIPGAADVVGLLVSGGHSAVAGRLAGAFRSTGRDDVADEILRTMRAAGYDVRESDPFAAATAPAARTLAVAPIVARMQELWEAMRPAVIQTFPRAPQPFPSRDAYLQALDDVYVRDAYHSLALEGFRVTPELIERVKAGAQVGHEEEPRERDVLAARGYWQAFQLVRATVAQVLAGANAGALARAAYGEWHHALVEPFVAAGAIGARADAEPRGSREAAPRWKAARDALPALFELLEREGEACVRAVLGHWMFGYVHRYVDGDGRLARFMMNVMLASGGYPWTLIRVEDRSDYLAALESASVDADIEPLARFVGERVRRSL